MISPSRATWKKPAIPADLQQLPGETQSPSGRERKSGPGFGNFLYANDARENRAFHKLFVDRAYSRSLPHAHKAFFLGLEKVQFSSRKSRWLRGRDLNPRPSGYEPDELPGCSTPRLEEITMRVIPTKSNKKPTQLERFFAWVRITVMHRRALR